MRTLVIADVHHRISAVDGMLTQAGKCDSVAWLGDWFDDFNDSPADAVRMAEWVACRMADHPEDIFLLGNHDSHYRFPYRWNMCSGFGGEKLRAIEPIMRDRWDNFFLCAEVNGWLLSHAGFHRSLADPIRGLDPLWLVEQEGAALQQAGAGNPHRWMQAGWYRGGDYPVGGPTWLDWDEEFEPIPGVNQIVGHTPHDEPKRKQIAGSDNWCLDTHSAHFAVIENGVVTVSKRCDCRIGREA
jgi:hypothetical protein